MEEQSELSRQTPVFVAFLCAITLVTGCYSLDSPPAAVTNPSIEVRNNAASLLYDLLGDEQNVSKLLIIKRDRRELHDVIKNVSSTADAARKALEKLKREDPTLNLKHTALPPGEKATRESESKARASELLHAAGADFEFKLLLTQAESLAYAQHLARVAAQNESSPERAKVFSTIGEQMKGLHDQVISLLRSNMAPARK